MPDMPDAKHATPPVARSRHAAAWITLGSAGATGISYNLYRSLHGGPGNPLLAVLLGVMPMTLAMLLTHVAGDAEAWMRRAVLAVMVGAMALSLSATASVVEPGAGIFRAYGFGLVLDAASLLAFRVIVTARQRENAAASPLAAALEEARRARAVLADEQDRAAAAEAELGAAGSALDEARQARAEAQEGAARAGALEDELAAVREQLDRALRALEKRPPAKRQQRASAGEDISLEFQALDILKADRTVNGAELGRRLEVSAGHGRKLRTRVLATLDGAPAEQS